MCKVSAPPPRPAPCAVDRFPSGSRLRVRERYGNEIAGIGEGLVNAALAMPRMTGSRTLMTPTFQPSIFGSVGTC
jgi:hypothetical protein